MIKEKRYSIISKSGHVNLSKAIAIKHDLGIVVDYCNDEIVTTGAEVDIEQFEYDLRNALIAHVIE